MEKQHQHQNLVLENFMKGAMQIANFHYPQFACLHQLHCQCMHSCQLRLLKCSDPINFHHLLHYHVFMFTNTTLTFSCNSFSCSSFSCNFFSITDLYKFSRKKYTNEFFIISFIMLIYI